MRSAFVENTEPSSEARVSGTFRLGVGETRMLDEHRGLRSMVAELRSACDAGAWSGGRMHERARRLAAMAAEHFAHEEDGGYMADVIASCPWMARAADRLLREHAFMREELMVMCEAPHTLTRARLMALLDLLSRHEREENAMVQELWLQDMGGS